jgi:hypothetical protein
VAESGAKQYSLARTLTPLQHTLIEVKPFPSSHREVDTVASPNMDEKDISQKAFWSTSASLFAFLLTADLYIYVPQDAVATAIGSLIGIYLFGLILWWMIWVFARQTAPRRRRFVSILAVLGCAATLIRHYLPTSA